MQSTSYFNNAGAVIAHCQSFTDIKKAKIEGATLAIVFNSHTQKWFKALEKANNLTQLNDDQYDESIGALIDDVENDIRVQMSLSGILDVQDFSSVRIPRYNYGIHCDDSYIEKQALALLASAPTTIILSCMSYDGEHVFDQNGKLIPLSAIDFKDLIHYGAFSPVEASLVVFLDEKTPHTSPEIIPPYRFLHTIDLMI